MAAAGCFHRHRFLTRRLRTAPFLLAPRSDWRAPGWRAASYGLAGAEGGLLLVQARSLSATSRPFDSSAAIGEASSCGRCGRGSQSQPSSCLLLRALRNAPSLSPACLAVAQRTNSLILLRISMATPTTYSTVDGSAVVGTHDASDALDDVKPLAAPSVGDCRNPLIAAHRQLIAKAAEHPDTSSSPPPCLMMLFRQLSWSAEPYLCDAYADYVVRFASSYTGAYINPLCGTPVPSVPRDMDLVLLPCGTPMLGFPGWFHADMFVESRTRKSEAPRPIGWDRSSSCPPIPRRVPAIQPVVVREEEPLEVARADVEQLFALQVQVDDWIADVSWPPAAPGLGSGPAADLCFLLRNGGAAPHPLGLHFVVAQLQGLWQSHEARIRLTAVEDARLPRGVVVVHRMGSARLRAAAVAAVDAVLRDADDGEPSSHAQLAGPFANVTCFGEIYVALLAASPSSSARAKALAMRDRYLTPHAYWTNDALCVQSKAAGVHEGHVLVNGRVTKTGGVPRSAQPPRNAVPSKETAAGRSEHPGHAGAGSSLESRFQHCQRLLSMFGGAPADEVLIDLHHAAVSLAADYLALLVHRDYQAMRREAVAEIASVMDAGPSIHDAARLEPSDRHSGVSHPRGGGRRASSDHGAVASLMESVGHDSEPRSGRPPRPAEGEDAFAWRWAVRALAGGRRDAPVDGVDEDDPAFPAQRQSVSPSRFSGDESGGQEEQRLSPEWASHWAPTPTIDAHLLSSLLRLMSHLLLLSPRRRSAEGRAMTRHAGEEEAEASSQGGEDGGGAGKARESAGMAAAVATPPPSVVVLRLGGELFKFASKAVSFMNAQIITKHVAAAVPYSHPPLMSKHHQGHHPDAAASLECTELSSAAHTLDAHLRSQLSTDGVGPSRHGSPACAVEELTTGDAGASPLLYTSLIGSMLSFDALRNAFLEGDGGGGGGGRSGAAEGRAAGGVGTPPPSASLQTCPHVLCLVIAATREAASPLWNALTREPSAGLWASVGCRLALLLRKAGDGDDNPEESNKPRATGQCGPAASAVVGAASNAAASNTPSVDAGGWESFVDDLCMGVAQRSVAFDMLQRWQMEVDSSDRPFEPRILVLPWGSVRVAGHTPGAANNAAGGSAFHVFFDAAEVTSYLRQRLLLPAAASVPT